MVVTKMVDLCNCQQIFLNVFYFLLHSYNITALCSQHRNMVCCLFQEKSDPYVCLFFLSLWHLFFLSHTRFLFLFGFMDEHLPVLFNNWRKTVDGTRLVQRLDWPASFPPLSPTNSSNKSSTALKAIDSETVWCNYQPIRQQRLPVK